MIINEENQKQLIFLLSVVLNSFQRRAIVNMKNIPCSEQQQMAYFFLLYIELQTGYDFMHI